MYFIWNFGYSCVGTVRDITLIAVYVWVSIDVYMHDACV